MNGQIGPIGQSVRVEGPVKGHTGLKQGPVRVQWRITGHRVQGPSVSSRPVMLDASSDLFHNRLDD